MITYVRLFSLSCKYWVDKGVSDLENYVALSGTSCGNFNFCSPPKTAQPSDLRSQCSGKIQIFTTSSWKFKIIHISKCETPLTLYCRQDYKVRLSKKDRWPIRLDLGEVEQRYTFSVLQTTQMKLTLLCVYGSAKTALKFKYEI